MQNIAKVYRYDASEGAQMDFEQQARFLNGTDVFRRGTRVEVGAKEYKTRTLSQPESLISSSPSHQLQVINSAEDEDCFPAPSLPVGH